MSPEVFPAGSDSDEGAYFDKLWRMAVKNRWVILATAVFVFLGVAFYTLGQSRIYRASSTLEIDPTPPSPLGRDVPAVITTGVDAFWNNQEYYETQYKIISSRRIASEAVRALGLNRDVGFLKNLPPGSSAEPVEVDIEQAVASLLGRLSVEPVKDSRLVNVSFEDADPERGRKVLTAVVDAYIQRNMEEVVNSNSSAGQWLRKQLIKLKDELEGSELALHDYKKDKRILSVSMDEQSNMLREEMQRLNAVLTDVRAQREHVLSRTRELAKVDPEDPVNVPAKELLESQLLGEMRSSYVEAKSEVTSLRLAGKGENHPEVLAAEGRVQATREALVREVKNVQGALRANLKAVTSEGNGLSQLLEGAKQRAFDLNLLEIEYRRLERTKANNEKLYSLVLERSKESDLASMMRFNNIHVVEDPLEGKAPIKPKVPLNLGLGAVAGILLGLLAAIGREQLDRSIKSSEDIERDLKLVFLGALPFAPTPDGKVQKGTAPPGSGTTELMAHQQPTSGLAEAARSIRTNLLFSSLDNPYRRLLVTSAGSGDGKTTVASAIAVAMAQAGQRVLLMDCDLRRPRLHRVFSHPNDFGVSSVTMDPSTLDPKGLETVVPNLSLLPAGPLVPNPAEFLQSEAFGAVLAKLSSLYDRVVIDSSPASIVTDSAILATQVDGVVFVVRASKTQREAAKKAIRALRDVASRIVGVVLNALDPKGQGYGRYYYYHYGYYGDEKAVEQSRRDAGGA